MQTKMKNACPGPQHLPLEDLSSPWAERQLRASFLSACDYDARAAEVRTHVLQLGQKLFACHGRLDHKQVAETSQSHLCDRCVSPFFLRNAVF